MVDNNNRTPLQLIRRLMTRTPMLRLALAVVVGILLAEYLPVPPMVWLWGAVGLCALLLVLVAICGQPLWKRIFPVLMWLIWIGIGAVLPMLHVTADPFPTAVGSFTVRL